MKINDQQFGRPQILYKATKAQIEATPNPQPGMVAFATDTNQMGIYTSGGWQWGSGGDMLKAVYDTDNNGVVDAAESVDWSGVQNKPTTYPPDSHNHAAGDVTSGVFDPARIPNLDASKITSGTLHTDRFSAYSDLQEESKFGLVKDKVLRGQDVRLISSYGILNNFIDFDIQSLPSGYGWAGDPFISPPTTNFVGGTAISLTGYTSSFRSFLYRSIPSGSASSYAGIFAMSTNTTGNYIGIRLDDGTDSNYVEYVIYYYNSTTEPIFRFYLRQRTGGGTIVETEITNFRCSFMPSFLWLYFYMYGTLWTNWQPQCMLVNVNGTYRGVIGSFVSWTPQRVGIVLGSPNALSWNTFVCDAFMHN